MEAILPNLPFLARGIGVTLQVTALSVLVAVPVAFLLALGKMSRVRFLRLSAVFIIEMFRGTSALVQLFWAFYVLPFFGITLPPISTAVIVLGLNSGSFFAESVRAAVTSVPRGQHEAALALNLSRSYSLFRIILPQAIPIMIPPFGNTVINLLKFSALASLVNVRELVVRADSIRSATGMTGTVYGLTLVVYFTFTGMIAMAMTRLERVVNERAGRKVDRLAGTAKGRKSVLPDWVVNFK